MNMNINGLSRQSPADIPSFSTRGHASTLPEEIYIMSISAFLQASDLAATSCVNRSWRDWTKDNRIWKHRFSQDERDSFAPLIGQSLLNWKETYPYKSLSSLVSNVVVSGMREFIRLRKNPTLQPRIDHLGLTIEPDVSMPEPYAQYGNYSFAICNLKNIEMQEAGVPTTTTLSGKEGILLTHLAVDGDFLFALQEDKEIVQWNYKTKEKVKKIITVCDRSTYNPAKFCVKNGLIILSFMQGSRSYLEIIPYEDPSKRRIISQNNFNYPTIILKDNQIIGKGLGSKWIQIMNLSNRKAKIYKLDSKIRNIYLDRHMLYVVKENQTCKINLKSDRLTNIAHLEGNLSTLTMVVNDIAFTCTSCSLTVEDYRFKIKTLETLTLSQNGQLQTGPLYNRSNPLQNINDIITFKTNLLKGLINRIKSPPHNLYSYFTSQLKSFLRDFGFLAFMIGYMVFILIPYVKATKSLKN